MMTNCVDEAAKLNAMISNLKKELDKLKAEIKEAGEGEQVGSDYKAIVVARESSSLDIEKATAVANKYGLNWMLKTVIDESILEDELAQGVLDEKIVQEFSKCINVKSSLAVNFKKLGASKQ